MAAYGKPTKPEDPDAPYLNPAEAAWVMRCSVKTIYRRIKDGMPHSRAVDNGNILISREDLDHQYRAHRVEPTPIRRPRRAAGRPSKQAALAA